MFISVFSYSTIKLKKYTTYKYIAALWNARVKWPRGSRFLFNIYRGYAALILKGTTYHILSKEGITQGDPLSMLMYAIAVLPLTQALSDQTKWNQNWYADDSLVLVVFQDQVNGLKNY